MVKEVLHKEIDLIQGVITRLANNSFLLKGWLISLIVIILTLSKDSFLTTNGVVLCIILYFPVIVFWYLDAFFLHKEKCYRKLYEWVINNRLTSDEYLYSLDYTRFKKDVNNVLQIMFSQTLLPFYGIALMLLIVLMFILK